MPKKRLPKLRKKILSDSKLKKRILWAKRSMILPPILFIGVIILILFTDVNVDWTTKVFRSYIYILIASIILIIILWISLDRWRKRLEDTLFQSILKLPEKAKNGINSDRLSYSNVSR
jgi:amino acid transporter